MLLNCEKCENQYVLNSVREPSFTVWNNVKWAADATNAARSKSWNQEEMARNQNKMLIVSSSRLTQPQKHVNYLVTDSINNIRLCVAEVINIQVWPYNQLHIMLNRFESCHV